MRFARCVKLLIAVVASLFILWLANKPRAKHDDLGWDLKNDDVAIPIKFGKNQREYIDSRGIHVVVGRYVGDSLPGPSHPNLTEEILNQNNFNPHPSQGEWGEPVAILPHEQSQSQSLYRIHRFNLLASDRIPLNRTLPDIRKPQCKVLTYNVNELPTTSVIIVFHNEAWSTLLRTVHSVINRSPAKVLWEIILVDDASNRTFLGKPLEDHVSKLAVTVMVLRSDKRIGLVRARLMGARKATGDVLTFLDAHCETTVGWLEPLLYRIKMNPNSAVCPIIDIISDDSFALLRSFELHHGGMSWNLHFRWFGASETLMSERRGNMTIPFRTPVMAGGLFAIGRDYFEKVGTYDDQMDIWGGENIEMSLRIWQCGGRVETSPCSHVAHVFRKSSPYTFPGGVNQILYSNLARAALVWMDEWKEFFFKMNPEANRLRDAQSIRSRLALRDRLKCNDFNWYLKNVWPENFFPASDRFFGKIIHKATGKCLERPLGGGGVSQPVGRLKLVPCLTQWFEAHLWVATWNSTKKDGRTHVGYIMSDESLCVDDLDGEARAMACSGFSKQLWHHNLRTNAIVHGNSGRCLSISRPPETPGEVSVHNCDGSSEQQWTLQSESWS
ncbi:polypeptide N-acetylgalactosaminyltransferase 1-like [Daphnia carinata]|uniref:polypeptide N-acetylgalactosaminyltransferase 1-like n=1 Tax=Daphnia carinata TaxID=120202 RepID=UPI002579564B|nr:polypeptide N-acetylgalactosaminyltransferase 1-like [Daphnia carinata]